MTTTELKNIAKANDLELVKVGNFDEAITGFKNFEQAQKLADENELRIVSIKQKGNGNFEYDCGGVDQAFNILCLYEADNNYTLFFKGDAEKFQECDIDETLAWMKEDEASEEEIAEFLKERNEVKARIENLTDDQFIALDCANSVYSEVLNKEDVCYYESDTNTLYKVALMLPRDVE